jgi:hypothetical protein
VLEAARCRERFGDVGQIVLVLVERGANGVDLANAAENFSVGRITPLRRNSCSSPLARDRRRFSHTDGITAAAASISSSVHAARVKCSSLIGAKLSL